MKNHRELLGIIANILIVIVVLLVIVVGLNLIGVYSLPDWAEKLIGTYDGGEDTPVQIEGTANEELDIKMNDEHQVLVTTPLSHENAKVILENISPLNNYHQLVTVDNISLSAQKTEKVNISRIDGLYNAVVSDIYGNNIRQFEETSSNVAITNYAVTPFTKISLPRGDFDVSESCGFILDVDAFLKSGFVLDKASFSQGVNEFGSYITIAFVNDFEGLKQTEQYTISLDYGVVISAFCFENESLVYSMTTQELSSVA